MCQTGWDTDEEGKGTMKKMNDELARYAIIKTRGRSASLPHRVTEGLREHGMDHPPSQENILYQLLRHGRHQGFRQPLQDQGQDVGTVTRTRKRRPSSH
jgi:hypothetical protein